MILTIRPATLADAEWIGERLRPEDEREVQTATGLLGNEAVPLSFTYSRECYVVIPSGPNHLRPAAEPCAIFGACDDKDNADVGIVWLLATEKVRLCSISVLREAQFWLDHFGRRYPRGLYNIVDARNDLHRRWLKLSGFAVQGSLVIRGQQFYYVLRRGKDE